MFQRSPVLRGFRQLTSITIATGVCSALAACGSAAPDSSSESDSASPAVSREAALYRDTQVCVVNDSPNIITVSFSGKNSSQGEGVMQPEAGENGQACAQGSFLLADDVNGAITTIKPDSRLDFGASNFAMKAPNFKGTTPPNNNTTCLGWREASVGATDTWDNGILKYTVTRESDDSNNIRCRVTVTGTEDPAIGGIARTNC